MASSDGSLSNAPGTKVKDLLRASREYEPLIPAAAVEYYLRKSGCIMADPELVRIVALASQRFAFDVVTEAKARAIGRQSEKKKLASENDQDSRPKLTTKDLEESLRSNGITSDVPPYYTGSS